MVGADLNSTKEKKGKAVGVRQKNYLTVICKVKRFCCGNIESCFFPSLIHYLKIQCFSGVEPLFNLYAKIYNTECLLFPNYLQ